ncbi:MAG TPA: hypothetical protein V6C72_08525, partial [Chroococcales cyanobacterium]
MVKRVAKKNTGGARKENISGEKNNGDNGKSNGYAKAEVSSIISPADFDAVLFDMDGVVTRTAAVHFAAWKSTFDELLEKLKGKNYQPFSQQDYLDYVDGKPREDGVTSFLKARKIKLPEGDASNAQPGLDSMAAVAAKKDQEFMRLVHTKGVEPYE